MTIKIPASSAARQLKFYKKTPKARAQRKFPLRAGLWRLFVEFQLPRSRRSRNFDRHHTLRLNRRRDQDTSDFTACITRLTPENGQILRSYMDGAFLPSNERTAEACGPDQFHMLRRIGRRPRGFPHHFRFERGGQEECQSLRYSSDRCVRFPHAEEEKGRLLRR